MEAFGESQYSGEKEQDVRIRSGFTRFKPRENGSQVPSAQPRSKAKGRWDVAIHCFLSWLACGSPWAERLFGHGGASAVQLEPRESIIPYELFRQYIQGQDFAIGVKGGGEDRQASSLVRWSA